MVFWTPLLPLSPYLPSWMLRAASFRESQLVSPELSGPTQQRTWASSQFQPGQWSSAPPSTQLLFLLLPSTLSLLWAPGKPLFIVSQFSPRFTSILNCSLLPSDNCLLWVSCWSNSLSIQIKSLKHKLQNFLPNCSLPLLGISLPTHLCSSSTWGEIPTPFICTCLYGEGEDHSGMWLPQRTFSVPHHPLPFWIPQLHFKST